MSITGSVTTGDQAEAAASRRALLRAGGALAAAALMGRPAAAGAAARAVCLPAEATDGPRRGRALAFDADGRLWVGDPSAGAVTVHEIDGAGWRRVGRIVPAAPAPGFGGALAVGAAGVLIGALGPGRPERAAGAVFLVPPGAERAEALARSDDATMLGHAVAASGPRLAWARRARDAAAPRGEIALEGPEGAATLRATGAATFAAEFLGESLALWGDVLVAGAPAAGPAGGAVIFDAAAPGAAPRIVAAPDDVEYGRLGAHVAAGPGGVLISGDGLVGRLALFAPEGGDAPVPVEGRGPVALSAAGAVFAGPGLRGNDWGPRRILAAARAAGGAPGGARDVAPVGARGAAWARVALSETHLALAWAGGEGPAGLIVASAAAVFDGAADVLETCGTMPRE